MPFSETNSATSRLSNRFSFFGARRGVELGPAASASLLFVVTGVARRAARFFRLYASVQFFVLGDEISLRGG